MNRLRDISLTRKLVYLILLVVIVVLSLAAAATVARDALTSRRQLSNDLMARADLMAKTLSVPVVMNATGFGGYEKEAGEALNYFSSDRHIMGAAVFLLDGRRLAIYSRSSGGSATRLALHPQGVEFDTDSVWVSTPIHSGNGELIGTLVINSDLTALRERLDEDIVIAVVVLVLSVFLALVLSAGLQRLISRPILELAQTADTVATEKNYSIRAIRRGNDEIGHLVDRFNEMLAQIATREDALRQAREKLEQRVVERTAALQQEIVERQRVEEGLRQSEARFTLAFTANPLAICIATLDEGRILNLNGAFTRMWGERPEPVIGQTLTEIGIFSDLATYRRLCHSLRANRPVQDHEGHFRTVDGRDRSALFSLARIDLDQTPAALIIITDITDRLNLEAQFRQSQKMEGIGQLAAGLAHDYNNILTVIQGYVDLMLEDNRANVGLADSLTQVSTAANRAANLTRQLLAFSRRQVIQPRAVELNEIVTNLVKMLARVLGEQVSLEIRLRPALPLIHADIGMIEQVITNLAVNSRDAMPSGGKLALATEIKIVEENSPRRHPSARPGRYVVLRVADTGCGMNAATLARAFEPFFTTKPAGQGTGLGLATVYGIVQQHQGWIEVGSEPDKGTEFRIYLPASTETRRDGDTEHLIAPPRGGHETILLVEDEDSVRKLAGNILKRAGYNILSAADGPEALRVWEANGNEIDLVFTDLVMPNGLTGRQLAEKLKAFRPGIKIIYTSGYSMEIAGRDLANETDFHFLSKPYETANLLRTIRARLDAN